MSKRLLLGAALLAAASLGAAADDDQHLGETRFNEVCAGCHGAQPVPRAKTRAELAAMPPEKIFKALSAGLMMTQAAALSEIEKRAIAQYVSPIAWGTVKEAAAVETLQQCAGNPPLPADTLLAPHWSGWGLDLDNTHFQPAAQAGLTAADLPNLELKWAFGFAGATTVSTQPAVAGGRIFLGSHEGGIYALDARSGCAYWKFPTPAAVRGAILLSPDRDGRLVLYAGDRSAHYYALDAASGKLLWQRKVDEHPYAVVTGSAALYEGVLYVPVASFEEVAGGSAAYPCCTFRGSVVALDAQTGEQRWKSWLLPAAQKTRLNAAGTQLWGPSGVAVWSQPTVDPQAGAIYVTTGDSYSTPAADTSDAVVALDLKTGVIRWHVQTTRDDAFSLVCVASNGDAKGKQGCGPDVDFGSSPILRRLPDGSRVLLAGQKSGMFHALDPDREGAMRWQRRLSPGGVLGGIEWGFAADETHAFVPISDVWENKTSPGHAGGLYAINIADGSDYWNVPAALPDCLDRAGCNAGQPAAATLIPGVVFSGSMDGHLRAYDSHSGKIVWDIDTRHDFPTVNGVPAHGGSIKGAGVTVVDGWVYAGSGYGLWGMPGNVFLAFGPRGR